jgi:predicted glycogen debranching enzyme
MDEGRAKTGEDGAAALGAPIDFGRELCGDFAAATTHEWLVTNGIGGFASGTIAGALTRRYHGLLIAALSPPLGRTLLCTKLEETVDYGGRTFLLGSNLWRSGAVSPDGHRHIERFRLEGTTPVWSFALADALLEKRIFMRRGENTTYVLYRLIRGSAALRLSLNAFCNYRDYHGATSGGWPMAVDALPRGLRIRAFAGAQPYYLLSDRAEASPRANWYYDYALSAEKARGFDGYEDHLCAGEFRATLSPGAALTLIATTDRETELDGEQALLARHRDERTLIAKARADSEPPLVQQLVLSADQFVVARKSEKDPDGVSIIAGYPWFGDWGRDTMISLNGLLLCTGRPECARNILHAFAGFVDRGLLPNRFLDDGEQAEYNTADATLHYFEALRAYHAATGDDTLLRELYPLLKDIIAWHERGTRHGIKVAEDGLLSAGEPGVQLTWMDAKLGDWVVTPRQGKPVEINALFYNALCVLADFAERLGLSAERDSYRARAARVRDSFARFVNPQTGYLFDVLDTPAASLGQSRRDDPSLRPNQILAVSLPHSALTPEQMKAVVDACGAHLLTSHGLRSLAQKEPGYVGRYEGDVRQRDGAYHQGTAWGWLIGPFVIAHYRVYGERERARSFLWPLLLHLCSAGLGSISEIFDGDSPHLPRGCIAQAWSVAEWLRAYRHTGP